MLFVLLATGPLPAQAGPRGGSLVIMGGNIHTALERVYRRFIALGGGVDKIRLAIIPAASGEPADPRALERKKGRDGPPPVIHLRT